MLGETVIARLLLVVSGFFRIVGHFELKNIFRTVIQLQPANLLVLFRTAIVKHRGDGKYSIG